MTQSIPTFTAEAIEVALGVHRPGTGPAGRGKQALDDVEPDRPRRDTGEVYDEFLTKLAQASGIATPTREDLAKIDKKRAKKGTAREYLRWQEAKRSR